MNQSLLNILSYQNCSQYHVDSAFTFTGKERDEETGYSYFGARYYDADLLTSWLSVDPKADKYPSMSPYNYCASNPVKLVDPDGRDWYKNEKSQYYTWFNGSDSHDGYSHIGEKGILLGEYESRIDDILKNYGHEGLYKEGLTLDFSPEDKGALIGSKDRGWDFLDEFFSGTGPEISILKENHPYTQILKESQIVKDAQQRINDGKTDVAGQITNVKSPFGISGIFSAGWSLARQYVGSYRFDAFSNPEGTALYNIISDCKSIHSLMYHITPDSWDIQRSNKRRGLSNTYQFYIWTSKR